MIQDTVIFGQKTVLRMLMSPLPNVYQHTVSNGKTQRYWRYIQQIALRLPQKNPKPNTDEHRSERL